jgi:hypothetical protein
VDASAKETGDGLTRLECVNADWIDNRRAEPGMLTRPELAEEAEREVSMAFIGGNFGPEGTILELVLEESPDDEGVHHYLNLTAEPIVQRPVELRWPDGEEAKRIARVTEIGPEEAGPAEVAEALSIGPGPVEAVAVYDVGQGSCAALIASGAPALYFDLGAGSLNGTGSRPRDLRRLCPTPETVVLSHWHYDHWALAKQAGTQLLERTWVVPRQPLRPASATLLGLIRRHGRALVRSPGPTAYRGAISLHRCTGRSLNDSGQAMLVRDPDGQRPVLLPGDARYRYVEDLPSRLHGLVVAHHGGWTGAGAEEIPTPELDELGALDPAASLAYSFGAENRYGHPNRAAEEAHAAAGWDSAWLLRTGERAPPGSTGHQHGHIYWDVGDREVALPCGGGCDLAPCKRA